MKKCVDLLAQYQGGGSISYYWLDLGMEKCVDLYIHYTMLYIGLIDTSWGLLCIQNYTYIGQINIVIVM